MNDESTPGRTPLRFHVEHVPPPPYRAPDHCLECGCNSVPCPRCVDDEGVPTRYPMTDQVRVTTHVGICGVHGVIAQRCAERTHLAWPLPDDLEKPPSEMALMRGFTIALLVGFIGGMLLGIFAVAPLILIR